MPQRILRTVIGLLLLPGTALAGDLLVRVEGRQAEGSVHLALVPATQKTWEPALYQAQSDSTLVRLPRLPPGEYAIQLFQDSNGNGHLDLSPRGIPLEPVGFSNDPSLFNGKPRPGKSRFIHGDADSEIVIRLHGPGRSRSE
ncbi:DUF2141 domain-containing protein [Pseudomonas sp. ABC1]|uniref:DUF2141 domain-containing protein n=1 Tax=Pseudomonas sp. ABC1 TaxID=2748080 RepID=UPI0015C2E2E4|nr:DUF2141 domain-containing protein [Pseudomonas sp. ABC1]QLF94276.1 DUF2141 domain-containing protein [Pseudomonas sp. ABC1]